MRRAAAALAACFCLLSAAVLRAEDTGLRSLITGDDSRGWEAVGRIELAGRGFCTGALIAPDLVLTAAHCLFDQATGARFPADQMRFLAGWRQGRAAAYRNVRRAMPHPDYDYRAKDDLARVANDLALLELDQPIRLPSIRPFEVDAEPRAGAAVGLVSYALDRSETPALQEVCHVLDRQSGLIVLSCSVDFGASGAPVFSLREGAPRIVSVISAKAQAGDRQVSLGVALDEPLATLRAALAAPQGSGPGAVIRPGAGAGAAGGGAKFLRP